MRRITLRVILRTALGLAPGPEMDRFEHKIETFLSNGRQRYALVLMTIIPIHRLSGSRWVPLFRQLSDLDDDLFAFIAARRRGEHPPSGENVLDDLLAATHEDGSPLDDQEVRDALITILIAGHDTTALALAWALADIVPRPEVVDRLADELRRVTGGGPPEAEHLPALEYLDGAIRESLRRSPVVPFVVRKTVQPFAAGGREYPAGVVLCPCSYLVHRREDLYPEPDRFRPERFLERKFGPHEWFPFGGGNRVCLGMPFALYEMKVLLATLFSQVRLARPAGARSRARRYGIVLGPDDGARVIVRGSTKAEVGEQVEDLVQRSVMLRSPEGIGEMGEGRIVSICDLKISSRSPAKGSVAMTILSFPRSTMRPTRVCPLVSSTMVFWNWSETTFDGSISDSSISRAPSL